MTNNYILVLLAAVSTISCSLEQPRCGSSFGTDGNMCSERLVANLSIDDSFSYDQQNAIMRETMLFKEDNITQEDVAHFDRLWNVRK